MAACGFHEAGWKVASTGLGTEEGWRNGSSLSFPAPPGKEQKPRLRTCWASLATWREGELGGEQEGGGQQVSLVPSGIQQFGSRLPVCRSSSPPRPFPEQWQDTGLRSPATATSHQARLGWPRPSRACPWHTEGQQPPHQMRGPRYSLVMFIPWLPGRPQC